MGEHKIEGAGLRKFKHTHTNLDRDGHKCKKHFHPMNGPGNRELLRHPYPGLSPHGRIMIFGESELRIPFQLTKKRPWVRRAENRAKNKRAKASRRINRGR